MKIPALLARCFALSLVLALGLSGCSGSSEDNSVRIVRTSYGVPHITASNWGGLGLGYGYAYSQDNFCVLMKEIIHAEGRSAEFLGEEGDLEGDFVWSHYNRDAYIEGEFIPAAPPELADLVEGYAEGMNRFLEETGVDGLAEGDEGCRGAAWVRPVTAVDLAKVYRKLILRAGIDALTPAIIAAKAPAGDTAAARPIAPRSFEVAATDLGFPPVTTMGSNAYAFGRDVTANGSGLLLGNPHFPWSGPSRFYMAHLKIPGEYDVFGASLHGVPLINIGFNQDVAWTHTVSTARRFTFFELQLADDDPMKYIYDGEEREIAATVVEVQELQPDGSLETRTETIYETHFGPIVDLVVLEPAVGGWPTAFGSVLAIRDANFDNSRAVAQWLSIGRATNLEELTEATYELGIPWVNTIAADRDGNALYADVGAMPHVTREKLLECAKSALTTILSGQGFPSLDGSRSECEWGSDADAPDGLFGRENLPQLPTTRYGANANDSYWLPSAVDRLNGFSPVIGREGVEQSIRTRQTMMQAEERIAGTDGLGAPGIDAEQLRTMMFGNRNLGGELVRDETVSLCSAVEDWTTFTGNAAEAALACDVLTTWDGLFNNDSVGAYLFQEYWSRVRRVSGLWAVPFDAEDPVHTPREPAVADPEVAASILAAFADTVDQLVENGIPADRPWGEVQFRKVGNENIPIHGGSGASMFSVISSRFTEGEGLSNIRAGNSFIQVVTWDESPCPDASAILTYSQSTDPASEHFADMTRLYSEKGWIDAAYCDADVEADLVSEIVLSR